MTPLEFLSYGGFLSSGGLIVGIVILWLHIRILSDRVSWLERDRTALEKRVDILSERATALVHAQEAAEGMIKALHDIQKLMGPYR